jgi:uncharacterized protein involved in exopolysaccharide biosynthesis
MENLFDRIQPRQPRAEAKEEVTSVERLKDLDRKIADAISKVKALKEENAGLSARVRELEARLAGKEEEIMALSAEKVSIRGQIEDLLNELEAIEIST